MKQLYWDAMNIRTIIAAAALALVLASPAAGQTGQDDAPPAGTQAPAVAQPPVQTLPPAYEEQMMRLAEILGSLHYLRELCGAKEGQLWRDEMEKLIEQEAPTDLRKQKLTARFNRGFRGFQEIYRECTPSAAEAANRYLRQGVRLSAEIPGRYGN
jgi:uncharacterized protein (TIGR02301 family)